MSKDNGVTHEVNCETINSRHLASAPDLAGAPLDIIIHLFEFLDPRDIIALRMTCNALSSPTYRRSVWLSALQRVCSAHGIFKPTYPTESMSQTHLEHAALAPYRFCSLLKRGSGPTPFVARTLCAHFPRTSTIVPQPRDSYTTVLLVTGGRFLITCTVRFEVHLWDLGVTAEAMIGPFPLVSMNKGVAVHMVHPMKDGKGILVVGYAVRRQRLARGDCFEVYKVYPTALSPAFVCVGSLAIPELDEYLDVGPFQIEAFDEKMVVLKGKRKVMVWNYAEGSRVGWETYDDIQTATLTPDRKLLVFYVSELAVYEIPALQRQTVCALDAYFVQNFPLLSYDLPGATQKVACIPQVPPYLQTHQGLSILTGYEDWMSAIAEYPTTKGSQLTSDVASPLMAVRFPYEWPSVDREFCRALAVCDTAAVLPKLDDRGVCAEIWTLPTPDAGVSRREVTLVWNRNILTFALCAASGRLCVVSLGNVMVLDFVVPLRG